MMEDKLPLREKLVSVQQAMASCVERALAIYESIGTYLGYSIAHYADFSDIRVYPPAGHHGIWILRPHTQSIENTLALLSSALPVLDTEPTQGRLWIIEPERVRIRE